MSTSTSATEGAATVPETEAPVPGKTTSKDVGWYTKELPELDPAVRELLENYSHVRADDVEGHILKSRDLAWNVYPYPCIGQFRFLDLSLSRQNSYASILDAVKSGSMLLDLGCCFAQDLRKLVHDGAPAANLWGADLEPEFLDLGYNLFFDRDRLGGSFLTADIFEEGCLWSLREKIDIIHIGLFLHLWDWDLQLRACEAIVGILKQEKGVRVLGQQMATIEPGPVKNGQKTLYKHDDKSFKKLWEEVGEKTGTKWMVTATLDQGLGIGQGKRKWDTDTTRRLVFEAVRI